VKPLVPAPVVTVIAVLVPVTLSVALEPVSCATLTFTPVKLEPPWIVTVPVPPLSDPPPPASTRKPPLVIVPPSRKRLPVVFGRMATNMLVAKLPTPPLENVAAPNDVAALAMPNCPVPVLTCEPGPETVSRACPLGLGPRVMLLPAAIFEPPVTLTVPMPPSIGSPVVRAKPPPMFTKLPAVSCAPLVSAKLAVPGFWPAMMTRLVALTRLLAPSALKVTAPGSWPNVSVP
jgi:hypothetical protein